MLIRKVVMCVLKGSNNIKNNFLSTKCFTTIVQKGSKVVELRKITMGEVSEFAKLTGDFNSVHFGEKAIVHGVLLNGFVSSIMGNKLPGPGYVVFQQSMSFPNPCRVGDDVEILVEVVEARKIVLCKYICTSVTQKLIVHQGTAKLLKFKG